MMKIEHKIISDVEHKWCSYKKHWMSINDFGINKSTHDLLV